MPMMQCANYAGPLTSLPTVEEVLGDHASELGHDFIAYRNHVYRVVNLCLAIVGDSRVELDKIAVAAVFHDLGIWANNTFDYIAPSVGIARKHLTARGMADWIPEIEAMIVDQRANPQSLVESFRRADFARVTKVRPRAHFHRGGRQNVAERGLPSTARSADDGSILEAPAHAPAD
jgi:hypothetical protein